MKTGRRGFLSSIAGVLTFAAFEQRVMAEVEVSSPTQLQSSKKFYEITYKDTIDDLCSGTWMLTTDMEVAKKAALNWTFDYVAMKDLDELAEMTGQSESSIKRFFKSNGVDMYDDDEYLDNKRPDDEETLQKIAKKFNVFVVKELTQEQVDNVFTNKNELVIMILNASNYEGFNYDGTQFNYC